jgi:hypothetical protein
MRSETHPISQNIGGLRRVFNDSVSMAWARPSVNAQLVASVWGDITKIGIFTYEISAVMDTIPAPVRHIGFSFTEDGFTSLNPPGWTFFENSIYWALRIR